MAVDRTTWLSRVSPLAGQLSGYTSQHFAADLTAGLVVAIMLVPQAMAYALLAGLPPQVGLYASIVPLILYSFLGTSNSLSVGPVAMVSLLVASGVGEIAAAGSGQYIQLCLTLALLAGLMQVAMSVFRMGFLVNFISHPVLVGFTSAAAIVIGVSQLKHWFGIPVENGEYPWQMIWNTSTGVLHTNVTTLAVGFASCLVLAFFAIGVTPLLTRFGLGINLAQVISKAGPLFAVVLMALIVGIGQLDTRQAVAIVGEIPAGLPRFTMPAWSISVVRELFPLALVITLVGYLESMSVAKALASRRREKIDPNRELFALGMADVGAALTGGYPVTGGFSRSLVNYSAGVQTALGSVFTALLVALSAILLTPLFYYVPQAVLAAIIVVAVIQLIDLKAPIRMWQVHRPDAIALGITFLMVLGLGIETGILIGIAATVVLQLWKTSRPHIAEVGRVAGSEHFRNVLNHDVEQSGQVLAIRIDESLSFANAPFVENHILESIADRRDIHTVLLIASGINDIDTTGIEVLSSLNDELNSAGVRFCMSDVKQPVLDRLQRAKFDPDFQANCIFLSAHCAMNELTQGQRATRTQDDTPTANSK